MNVSENFADKNILITGCAGFIGSHLAEDLVNQGANVIGIDNLFNGSIENLESILNKNNFKFIQIDIRNKNDILKITKNIEIIFHEAALINIQLSIKKPELCNDININGTLNILNAARRNDVERLIFASSAAIYGNNPELPKREVMCPEPSTPYAITKLTGESYTIAFYKSYGLKTTVLRYFNVYGPKQRDNAYSGVITNFIERILKESKSPIIFGDGTQTRDFIFIKDVVKANLLASLNPKSPGEIFNVATGKPITINSLCKLILKYVNCGDLIIKNAPKRSDDILNSYADIAKTQKILDFKPDFTIEEGLKIYINFLRKLHLN